MHDVPEWLLLGWYFPLPHATQMDPLKDSPLEHVVLMQSLEESEPCGEVRPLLHRSQDVLSALSYLPAGQYVQLLLAAVSSLPAGHMMHEPAEWVDASW